MCEQNQLINLGTAWNNQCVAKSTLANATRIFVSESSHRPTHEDRWCVCVDVYDGTKVFQMSSNRFCYQAVAQAELRRIERIVRSEAHDSPEDTVVPAVQEGDAPVFTYVVDNHSGSFEVIMTLPNENTSVQVFKGHVPFMGTDQSRTNLVKDLVRLCAESVIKGLATQYPTTQSARTLTRR
jgi:hypothetical protein